MASNCFPNNLTKDVFPAPIAPSTAMKFGSITYFVRVTIERIKIRLKSHVAKSRHQLESEPLGMLAVGEVGHCELISPRISLIVDFNSRR